MPASCCNCGVALPKRRNRHGMFRKLGRFHQCQHSLADILFMMGMTESVTQTPESFFMCHGCVPFVVAMYKANVKLEDNKRNFVAATKEGSYISRILTRSESPAKRSRMSALADRAQLIEDHPYAMPSRSRNPDPPPSLQQQEAWEEEESSSIMPSEKRRTSSKRRIAFFNMKRSQYRTGFVQLLEASSSARRSLCKVLEKWVRKEVINVFKPTGNSCLRRTFSLENMEEFSWAAVMAEAQEHCPFLLAALTGALTRRKDRQRFRRRNQSAVPAIGSIFSTLGFLCNPKRVNIFQSINSFQMWLAGCKAEVFARFNFLGWCLCKEEIDSAIDKLCSKHDGELKMWQMGQAIDIARMRASEKEQRKAESLELEKVEMTITPAVGNILFCTDSYKVTHHLQYPEGTTHVYSYFESRGGLYPETVFFGLQYIIKRWLQGQVVTKENIAEAKALYETHFGQDVFNEKGWTYILEKHNGRLPLLIKAVPEGTVVPTRNVLFTVENTDPKVPWLTNWFETILVHVWYPMTVATHSRAQKAIIARHLNETADNLDSLPFKLHDFGFRGVASVETAAIGGASHLVNFMGTDTVAGLVFARKYYNCDMAGFSIPAAEHSTITTWGRRGEREAFANMLTKFPNGLVAVVSDSFDIYQACVKIWGQDLKDLVVERGERDGVLMIRPDSGYPPEVVVKILNVLGEAFGTVTNCKGYKELPKYIRVIQGDGIDPEMLDKILNRMKENMWSAENLTFGSGGSLLQQVNRDTQKCAFKCSFCRVNGQRRSVFKQPVTDPEKTSKKGRLSLELRGDQYVTVPFLKSNPEKDLLVPVFENGSLRTEYNLDEIRERAELPIVRQAKSK